MNNAERKPSIFRPRTLRTTAELVQGRSKRPSLVIVNAVPAQGTRHEQDAESIAGMGLAVCPVHVGQRVAFEYAAQAGQSVTEYELDGRAASDISPALQCDMLSTCRKENVKKKRVL